jgi:hypothetical protein
MPAGGVKQIRPRSVDFGLRPPFFGFQVAARTDLKDVKILFA